MKNPHLMAECEAAAAAYFREHPDLDPSLVSLEYRTGPDGMHVVGHIVFEQPPGLSMAPPGGASITANSPEAVYLIILDQGGLFGAYLDAKLAIRKARAVKGVVAVLPIVGDFR